MFSATILAMALQAATLEARSRENHCSDPQTQLDMNFCAEIDFERADLALNRAYAAAIVRAQAADRELDRTSDQRPTSETVLRTAQRAWITFRDAQCTYAGYEEARGGSMEPMVYNGCRATVTRARTDQLQAFEQEAH